MNGRKFTNKSQVLATSFSLSVALLWVLFGVNNSNAGNLKNMVGEKTFAQNCAQCHVNGGNLVNPNKPLRGSDKLVSLPIFKDYLKDPKGHMPYYKHIISDDKVLRSLWKYCQSLGKEPIKQATLPDCDQF